MKKLTHIFILIFISFLIISCSSDDNSFMTEQNPTENLRLVKQMAANGHLIELYSENSQFLTGYNEVFIRLKDASGEYIENFNVQSWLPIMNMAMHSHSSPFSDVHPTEFSSMKRGYIVFNMASNEEENWELSLHYSIGAQNFSAHDIIEVHATGNRRKVMNFQGNDGETYIIAYVSPKNPQVAINDIEALLFKRESMMNFPLVENYTIQLDPRMPGMGNHSSPNNRDLTFDAAREVYAGKLSLTMTGYWKLNFIVLDENNENIAGTQVTEENESSNVYLEIEF